MKIMAMTCSTCRSITGSFGYVIFPENLTTLLESLFYRRELCLKNLWNHYIFQKNMNNHRCRITYILWNPIYEVSWNYIISSDVTFVWNIFIQVIDGSPLELNETTVEHFFQMDLYRTYTQKLWISFPVMFVWIFWTLYRLVWSTIACNNSSVKKYLWKTRSKMFFGISDLPRKLSASSSICKCFFSNYFTEYIFRFPYWWITHFLISLYFLSMPIHIFNFICYDVCIFRLIFRII